jgi:hypothetical protein
MRYLLAYGVFYPDTRPPKASQTVLSDSTSTPQIGNIPTDNITTNVAVHVAWQ